MLEIGVQTKGLIPEKSPMYAIRQIKAAGFDRIDMNLDIFLKNTDLYAGKTGSFFDKSLEELCTFFTPYVEAMLTYGVRPSQMHAPYPVRVEGRWEQNAYMQSVVIPKSLVIAEFLDVPYVVIHPFKMQYMHGREAERRENIEYFKMLIPLAKQCGVKICMENLYESVGGRITEGVCADPKDALWYIDTLNELAGEEIFGFCLDTGHLQLVKRDPYDFIKRLGKRLKVVHLHENDFVGDLHQMPYTFGNAKEQGLDWNGIVQGLSEINYQGTLSFETFPCVNGFPKEMTDAVLKTIHDIGMYLSEEIEKSVVQGKSAGVSI